MSFEIMQLEDRIVFDALVVGDDADDSVEAAVETPPVVFEEVEAEVEAAPEFILDLPAEQPVDAVHLLVVSSDADPESILPDATRDTVTTLTYDADTVTLDSLLAEIELALGGREADSIGFAVHGEHGGAFALTGSEVVTLGNLQSSASQQTFWTGIGSLLTADGRIDIISCDLASTDGGIALADSIEDLAGHEVAASDDLTGGTEAGGDWILEHGGIDLTSIYFDAELLEDFDETLVGWMPEIQKINWNDYISINNPNNINTVSLDAGRDALVFDQDNSGWNGGSLTARMWSASAMDDNLDFDVAYLNANGVFNGIGAGNAVGDTFEDAGNNTIATIVSDGENGSNLVVSFTSFTTKFHIEPLIQSLLYRPGNGASGSCNFEIQVTDQDFESGWANGNIYVNAPSINVDGTRNIDFAGDIVDITGDLNGGGGALSLEITDVDSIPANITFWVDDMADNGILRNGLTDVSWGGFTLADVIAGNIKYHHNAGEPLYDSIKLYAQDNNGARSQYVNLLFTGSGDVPPIVDLTPWDNGSTNRSDTLWGSSTEVWLSSITLEDNSYQLESVTVHLTNLLDAGRENLWMDGWDEDNALNNYGIDVIGLGTDTVTFVNNGGGLSHVSNFQNAMSNLRYFHDISGRTAGNRFIELVADDGTGNNSAIATWKVDVQISTDPFVQNNWMETHDADVRVIHEWNLRTADGDTGPAGLTYTINRLPWHGQLRLNGSVLGVGATFTQAQVNAGLLVYANDGLGSDWDDFEFKVSDGITTLNNQWFWINVLEEGVPLWQPPQMPGSTGDFIDAMESFGEDAFGEDGDFGDMGDGFMAFIDNAESMLQDLADRVGDAGDEVDIDAADTTDTANTAGDAEDGADNTLDSLSDANDDAMSFLGEAVKAIKESRSSITGASTMLDGALDLLEGLDGEMKVLLQQRVQEVLDSIAEVKESNQDLIGIIKSAIDAGKLDKFDKAFGDAIGSSIKDVNLDNDRLRIAFGVLESMVEEIGTKNGDDPEILNQLKASMLAAKTKAQRAVDEKRELQDKAADDVIAAGIKALLQAQDEKQPEGKPEENPLDQPIGAVDDNSNDESVFAAVASGLALVPGMIQIGHKAAGNALLTAPENDPLRALNSRHKVAVREGYADTLAAAGKVLAEV